ncbi:phosphatidylinositol mannoside acyltransferase [Bifidobacterium xylocopae]|uniref:Phosphatidylinositol mannoside acyltransferase n=1 Tax=Bifidobacterium xylocopae TaxID=2493119 RepID=A0A366KC41_9BIFI|nr:phosphatidylinositol mannoside acyltransferase [Bifidobacterium xylocopae]RBP99290.1 phosphatidylinositol mannoside acyltransferase [Bifidobacterium xylocopae]
MVTKLLLVLMHHVGHVPEGVLRTLSNLAADLAWALHMGGVPQLERNLRHVMGPLPRVRLRQMSRESLRSYFAYFCEALTVGARTPDELMARVRTEGSGYPDPARSDIPFRSVPIAMGHQGNWDYAGFWAGHELGHVTTVAERLADQELLEAFVRIRTGLGMTILLTGQEGLIQRLTDRLHDAGQVVPLLADRDLSRNGVFVHAFDSVIRVAAGPAVLALDTDLPLYTVNMHRERLHGARRRRAKNPYGYVCRIDGPIDITPYRDLPRGQAVQRLTQAWVDQWAVNIRSHPQDWHMMQPIFVEDLDSSRLHNVPPQLREVMQSHGNRRREQEDGRDR